MSEETMAGGTATVWLAEKVDQDAQPPTAEAQKTAERLEALLETGASSALAPSKAATLRAILKTMRDSIDAALRLLEDAVPESRPAALPTLIQPSEAPKEAPTDVETDRVTEGVFDGEGMVGDDGKTYTVPPNYASKSKLVEGDMLKLTIGARGNFMFKQIGPIERQRLIGAVAYDQDAEAHIVMAGGRAWRVLKASMTYFKAEAGDEAVILVPKNAPSKWAAVENIIKKSPQQVLGTV